VGVVFDDAAEGMADAIINRVLRWIAVQLTNILDWLWQVLAATLFVSPQVSALPQVQQASATATVAANTVMALVLVIVGVTTVINGGSEQARYTLKSLLPRFAAGMLLANFAPVVVAESITMANAVTAALTGHEFSSQDSVEQMHRMVAGAASSESHALLLVLLHLTMIIALVALLITWLLRLATLIICAAVGPLALACHALPVTEPLAAGWWRSLAGALLTQVLQAATLNVAWATLLSADGSLPAVITTSLGDPLGMANLGIAAFLTFLVALIPRHVRRLLNHPRTSTTGRMLMILLVHPLVNRATAGLGRAARNAAGPTAAARQPTSHLHTHAPGSHQNLHLHQHQHLHMPRNADPGRWQPATASNLANPAARPHPGTGMRQALPPRPAPRALPRGRQR
jgi:hypothetical protein